MSATTTHARAQATVLLRALWRERHLVWDPTPSSPDDVFPLDVRRVAENGLGVRFEEPEEIQTAASHPYNTVPVETAGLIDREGERIVVAQKFPHEYRRFTGAHEIAHWLLHPDLNHHRDRPLKGNERLAPKRPQAELEADAFAAELLMPSRYLRRCYLKHYRSVMRVSALDEHATFWLGGSNPRGPRARSLAAEGKRQLSLRIATCDSFGYGSFVPLAEQFGVSPTATAIRLEELHLVVN